MPNSLSQYYVEIAPPPEPPTPAIIGLSPSLSIEFILDKDYETEVAQLTLSILQGVKMHYFFPEVTNELTEV